MSYDGMTDPLGQSQVLPYLIGLSRNGYNITLVSCEKKDRFVLHKDKIAKLTQAANINWEPVFYTSFPPVISTVYDILKLKLKAKSIYKNKKIDIVHCRSYITAFAGLYLKRKFNVRFIFDMRGFFADERVDGGLWNLKNPLYNLIYKYFKKKEIQFFSNADYVVSLTENGKNEIHKWKHIPKQPIPIQVIPCCADLNLFSENNIDKQLISELRNRLGIKPDDFVVSYLGSIGTWYMLDEMLDFFKRLLIRKPTAKFLFITPDKKEHILSKAANRNIPEASIIILQATREEVPAYALLSNLSLFFIKPVYSKKASSPTKQGEIMGLGIPIICNGNVGDTEEIINDSGAGYVINIFNDEEYDKAIDNIPELLNIPEDTIRRGAMKYYSLDTGIVKYNEIYEILIKA